MFIATPSNSEFLGPSSIEDMAQQIATREGPSGPNYEYLYRLKECMTKIGVEDPHLHALYQAVVEFREIMLQTL